MIKENALELAMANRKAKREEAHDRASKANAKKAAYLTHLIHKLMKGEHLSGEEGRQVCWDLLANANVLKLPAMTGNSQTYYRLGQQSWANVMIKTLKSTDLKLAHQMELEALVRDKKEEIENV